MYRLRRASEQSSNPYESAMLSQVSVYNFAWEDMTTPSMALLTDIVRVAVSCIRSGGKVCHADRAKWTSFCCKIPVMISFAAGISSEDAVRILGRTQLVVCGLLRSWLDPVPRILPTHLPRRHTATSYRLKTKITKKLLQDPEDFASCRLCRLLFDQKHRGRCDNSIHVLVVLLCSTGQTMTVNIFSASIPPIVSPLPVEERRRIAVTLWV